MTSVSVVIVTHGRSGLLKQALDSFAQSAHHASEYLTFELVGLVNGPDQESLEVLKAFSQWPKKIISMSERLEPGDARNAAVKLANGDWIYFADDDVVAPKTLFQTFANRILVFPQASVLGGPNLTPKESNVFQLASGIALSSPLASYKCSDRYRKQKQIENCDESSLILCNLFVRAPLTRKFPFPTGYVCAEENHVLARWKEAGAMFLYEPELAVDHVRRSTWLSFFKQVLKYGRGRGRLIANGDFSWFHLIPIACVAFAFAALTVPSLHFALLTFSAIYAIAVLAEAFRLTRHQMHAFSFVAISIVTIHVAYAFGVARGATIDAYVVN